MDGWVKGFFSRFRFAFTFANRLGAHPVQVVRPALPDPRLFRELQAAAGGMEGIDVKATRKALNETAGEVLRAIVESAR